MYLQHAAVIAKCGLEIDLRRARDTGQLVLSHDPTNYRWTICAERAFKYFKAFIALNIKESGLLEDFHKIAPTFNGFVFDFELCNASSEIDDWLNAGYKVAKRFSDRGETPSGYCDYIWVDEMDKTGSLDLSNVDLSKCVYVSPELHGRDRNNRRTEEFFAICSDYSS